MEREKERKKNEVRLCELNNNRATITVTKADRTENKGARA